MESTSNIGMVTINKYMFIDEVIENSRTFGRSCDNFKEMMLLIYKNLNNKIMCSRIQKDI